MYPSILFSTLKYVNMTKRDILIKTMVIKELQYAIHFENSPSCHIPEAIRYSSRRNNQRVLNESGNTFSNTPLYA